MCLFIRSLLIYYLTQDIPHLDDLVANFLITLVSGVVSRYKFFFKKCGRDGTFMFSTELFTGEYGGGGGEVCLT